MADKTNVPRLNMRYGLICTSPDAGKKIADIRIPASDQKYFILRPDMLQGVNEMDFSGSRMPVMADGVIMYPEMPVLAVVAPDYESAALALRDIKIVTGEKTEESKELSESDYGWGNIDEFRSGRRETVKKEREKEEREESSGEENEEEKAEGENEEQEDIIVHEYRKIESSFSMKAIEYRSYNFFTASCWAEGSRLHVMVPSQYPNLVRDTVASVTGYSRKAITVHTSAFSDISDEYLIYPAIVASIAASASISLKCPVEIKSRAYNRRGEIRTKRITYLNEEMKIVAEEVTHTVDIGAYPMLEEELKRETMAGIIPLYALQAFKATVRLEKSFSFPSFMFSSMGYSEAIASSEYHSSSLARAFGMSPADFRQSTLKDKRKFTDYLPASPLSDIKSLLATVASKSSFNRRWSANDLIRSSSLFLGYTRGIGISAAVGISGFSRTFSSEHDYKAKLTYTQKGSVVVETSAYVKAPALSFWKKIVKQELGIISDDSIIFQISDFSTMDSGPKVLSRFISSFSNQLQANARKLKELMEREKPPVSITFDVENRYAPSEFDESSYGAMAIEVFIPDSSYTPYVREVWASYSVGLIANADFLTASVKRLILRTLTENGMSIRKDTRINITFSRGSLNGVSSVAPLTKGLVIGSLESALEQAVGKKVSLPVKAEEILMLRKKGKQI